MALWATPGRTCWGGVVDMLEELGRVSPFDTLASIERICEYVYMYMSTCTCGTYYTQKP